MGTEHSHAVPAKPRISGRALLWMLPVLTVFLLAPGAIAVLINPFGGLELLSHDPMNLLPQIFLGGTVAGLGLFAVVSSIIALYVVLPRWLRTKTRKGTA